MYEKHNNLMKMKGSCVIIHSYHLSTFINNHKIVNSLIK